jgi:hypothetical protein
VLQLSVHAVESAFDVDREDVVEVLAVEVA